MCTMCNHGVPLGARDHRTVAKGCDGFSGDGTWVSHYCSLEQDADAELSSAFPFRRPILMMGLLCLLVFVGCMRYGTLSCYSDTAQHCTALQQRSSSAVRLREASPECEHVL